MHIPLNSLRHMPWRCWQLYLTKCSYDFFITSMSAPSPGALPWVLQPESQRSAPKPMTFPAPSLLFCPRPCSSTLQVCPTHMRLSCCSSWPGPTALLRIVPLLLLRPSMTLAGVCCALTLLEGLVPEVEVGGTERSICFMGERRLYLQARAREQELFCRLRGVSGVGAFKILSSINPHVLTSGSHYFPARAWLWHHRCDMFRRVASLKLSHPADPVPCFVFGLPLQR